MTTKRPAVSHVADKAAPDAVADVVDTFANAPMGWQVTVSPESADAIMVTCKLLNARGAVITSMVAFPVWLSQSAHGDKLLANPPEGLWNPGSVGAVFFSNPDNTLGIGISDGILAFRLVTSLPGLHLYFCCAFADGSVGISPPISFS